MSALSASAQFNQTISVDGKYVPEVIRQERLNTFPRSVKFALESTPLNYEGRGVNTPFVPQLTAMPATGWRDTRSWSDTRGYLDVGAGSWLNSTLNAGYRIFDDAETLLGVKVGHTSTSLWKPKVSERVRDVKMWRYDESAALFGSRDFGRGGRLSGEIGYHFGSFDYYGYNPVWLPLQGGESVKAPGQKLHDGSLRLTWNSPAVTLRSSEMLFDVTVAARHFGYESSYLPYSEVKGDEPGPLPVETGVALLRGKGTRENHLSAQGGVLWKLGGEMETGLRAGGDWLIYGRRPDYLLPDSTRLMAPEVENYGVVSLNPFFNVSFGNLAFHLGVKGDYAINAGERGNRYAALHFAPDVKGEYTSGILKGYVTIGGGTTLNTLASGYQLDYYRNPRLESTMPVYTPFDGRFGLGITPGYGVTADAWVGYRVVRGERLGGWYQYALNYAYSSAVPGLPVGMQTPEGTLPMHYDFTAPGRMNMHGFSVGGEIGYEFSQWVKCRVAGSWQPQDGSRGYFNGYDVASRTLDATVQSTPWRTLTVGASYHYRGGRRVYVNGTAGQGEAQRSALVSAPLGAWSMLGATASYKLDCGVSFWLQADNLFNRHTPRLPGLPDQGLQFMVGAGYVF